MKVMLNFIPLATGGGVQVALDFLKQANEHGAEHEWQLVVRDGSPFTRVTLGSNFSIVRRIPNRRIARLSFEYLECKRLIRRYSPDVIYTQFGPVWPGAKIRNVAGCAYSNLFYPEIDFWGALPWHQRIVKRFIDWQRRARVRRTDLVIFETDDLARRARIQLGLPTDRVVCVRPAASHLVTPSSTHTATRIRCRSLPAGHKVLLLSGYHPNKNLELMVETAALLKAKGRDDIKFILTLQPEDPNTRRLLSSASERGVDNLIHNFGPVPPEGCCELYRACDVSVLASNLESFSNTIAESWSMGIPLVIGDMAWTRQLCGSAAVYFEHLNPRSLMDRLESLADGRLDTFQLLASGARQLATYPNPKERFESYLALIEGRESM